MPLQQGDDVYIEPVRDTGEITQCHLSQREHDVLCDDLKSEVRYAENLLKLLPYKGSIRDGAFLIKIKARKTFRGYRKLEISHHVILPDGNLGSRRAREFKGQK